MLLKNEYKAQIGMLFVQEFTMDSKTHAEFGNVCLYMESSAQRHLYGVLMTVQI